MKKGKLSIIIAASIFPVLFSCEGLGTSGNGNSGENATVITFTTQAESWDSGAALKKGDESGLFATGAVVASNHRLMYDGEKFVSVDGNLTWNSKDSTVSTASFAAYYPYRKDLKDSKGTCYVNEDQTSQDAYRESDFLMAKADLSQSSALNVNLSYKHGMSRFCIYIDNQSECPISSVVVKDVAVDAFFDLYKSYVQTDSTSSRGDIKAVECTKSSGETFYAAILPPQSVQLEVCVTVKKSDIIFKSVDFPLSGVASFSSGKQLDNSSNPIVFLKSYVDPEDPGTPEGPEFSVAIGDWSDDGEINFTRK